MRDTGLADRLRAAGLRVVECAGWQTRGSDSFAPAGSVNHHTAGPPTGATPSLNTCINGRPDLEGPLCNVMQSREPDGDDIAYVVAAGRANHAGEGAWRGQSGNSAFWGLEIEHTGTDPLPEARQRIAARIHAAMWGGDPGMVCQHAEYALPPGRKIDAATGVDGDDFRAMVAGAAGEEGDGELTPEEHDQLGYINTWINVLQRALDMPGQATEWKGNLPGRVDAIYDTVLPGIADRLERIEAKLDALT